MEKIVEIEKEKSFFALFKVQRKKDKNGKGIVLSMTYFRPWAP